MIKNILISFIFIAVFLNNSYAINDFIKKADAAVDNDISDAVFYYQRSIEEYPKDIQAYTKLAQVRLKQKEYVKALTNLLKAKDLDENNFEVNYYLGEYHYKRENFYKSIKYYNKAQKIRNDKDQKLWLKIGQNYEKLADIQKAKTSYVNTLLLDNKNVAALNSLKRLDKLEEKQEHRY